MHWSKLPNAADPGTPSAAASRRQKRLGIQCSISVDEEGQLQSVGARGTRPLWARDMHIVWKVARRKRRG
jgi:hypothetical protein